MQTCPWQFATAPVAAALHVKRPCTIHFKYRARLFAGPMLLGMTQVVFEGVPTYPDAGRAWAITDKYKVPYPAPHFPVQD